jgi:hypothetical protein
VQGGALIAKARKKFEIRELNARGVREAIRQYRPEAVGHDDLQIEAGALDVHCSGLGKPPAVVSPSWKIKLVSLIMPDENAGVFPKCDSHPLHSGPINKRCGLVWPEYGPSLGPRTLKAQRIFTDMFDYPV